MFDHLPTEATPFIAGPITGTLDGNFSITDLCSSFFTSGLALVSPSACMPHTAMVSLPGANYMETLGAFLLQYRKEMGGEEQ